MTFLYLFIRIANPFHSSLVGSIPRKKNPEMEIVGIKIIFYLYIYLSYHVIATSPTSPFLILFVILPMSQVNFSTSNYVFKIDFISIKFI